MSSGLRLRPVSSERIVFAGLVGLLGLMAALAIDSSMQAHDVSIRSTELRRATRARDAVLDQLRSETYRSATLVRDYLAEVDESRAAYLKSELLVLRIRLTRDLDEYGRIAPPAEAEAINVLKRHSDAYWSMLAPVLRWDAAERRRQRETLTRTVIGPRRDELVQLVKRIGALDEQTLDEAEQRIQTVQDQFRVRVWGISVVALILGVVLVAVVIHRVKRLTQEAERRFDQVSAARKDLKRLSDRLLAVQEEERRSLSRELHDDLGQAMSAMLFELGQAEAKHSGCEAGRDELAAARRLAEETIAKIRNMALVLRPAMLDELGLVPALHWQAREVARRTGLNVRLIADEVEDDLPEARRVCVYRVVQEALNNCVKHARASEVRIVVRRERGELTIFVQDDGAGFDVANNKGLGLLGMAERVNAAGGCLHVESEPGRGSIVSASLPLDDLRAGPRRGSTV